MKLKGGKEERLSDLWARDGVACPIGGMEEEGVRLLVKGVVRPLVLLGCVSCIKKREGDRILLLE